MPKKQTKEVESAVVEEKQEKHNGFSYEVAPAFKRYASFLLDGGVVIPVKDGKVTAASDSIVKQLREGGFIT